MTARSLWVIISPVFRPAPGGAALYSDILCRGLAAEGRNVLVITEKFPGLPALETLDTAAGKACVRRLFPFRAGRNTKDLTSYLDYAIQNIQALALPRIIRQACLRASTPHATILIHSSFFYNPGMFGYMLGHLRGSAPNGATLVVDVRDPLFSEEEIATFAKFDGAIGCSRTIADRLRSSLPPHVHVEHIPIPFDPPPRPKRKAIAAVLRKFGLTGTRFLFNPNGIQKAKQFPLMIETTRALRRIPGYSDIVLVTIGRARDLGKVELAVERDGVSRYLGSVPNSDALCLAAAGVATLVLNQKEGLPRSALESIALGQLTIVPDLPEFRETIPDFVGASAEPEVLAAQIIGLVTSPRNVGYPLEQHAIKSLMPLYKGFEKFAAKAELEISV